MRVAACFRWGEGVAGRVHREKVVGEDTFQAVAVPEDEFDSEADGFGPGEEFAALFQDAGAFQITNKRNGFDLGVRDLADAAVGEENLYAFGL